jgi:hypothetical protein
MKNEVKFRAIGVGTCGVSYKWDVPLTVKEYSELKKALPEYSQNGCSFTFVKDYFKDKYILSIICYFDLPPFNSEMDAETYMTDDNLFMLYSKHPMLNELNEIRHAMIKIGVGQ